jgi:hypothetical protein
MKLGETLDQPPECFSEDAKTAWQKDVDTYLKGLKGLMAFHAYEYDGPYNVIIDYEYDRNEKEPYIVLQLSSLSEDGNPKSFRIKARRIKQAVKNDREVLIAAYDAKGSFNSKFG